MSEIHGVQEILEDLLALGDPKAASLIARARVALEIARTRTALYETSTGLSTTPSLDDAVSVVSSNIHKLLNVEASSITTHIYLKHAPDSTLYDLTVKEDLQEFLAESEDHLLANDDEIFSDDQASDVAVGIDSPAITDESGFDISAALRVDPRGRTVDSDESTGHAHTVRSRNSSVGSTDRDNRTSTGRNSQTSPFHSPTHGPRSVGARGNYDVQIPDSLNSGALDGIMSTSFAPSRDTDGLVRTLSSINLMHLQGNPGPGPNNTGNTSVNTSTSTGSVGATNANPKTPVENAVAPPSPSPGTPGTISSTGPLTPRGGSLTPGAHNLPPSPSFGAIPRPSHMGLPPLHLPVHGTPSMRSPVRGPLPLSATSNTLVTSASCVAITTPYQAALHVLQTGNSQVINPQRPNGDRQTPVLSPLNPESSNADPAAASSTESADFALTPSSFSNPGPSPFKRANSSLNLLIEEAAAAAGAAEAISQGVTTPRLHTSSFTTLSPSPRQPSSVLSHLSKSSSSTDDLGLDAQSAPSPSSNNPPQTSPPSTPRTPHTPRTPRTPVAHDSTSGGQATYHAASGFSPAPPARQRPTFLAVPFLVPYVQRNSTNETSNSMSNATPGIRNTMGHRRPSYRRQFPDSLEMTLLGALIVHVPPSANLSAQPFSTSASSTSDAWSPPPLRRRSSMRQLEELSNEVLLEPLSTLTVQFSDCWARLRQAMAAREAQRQAEGLVRILKALSQEVVLPAIISNILGVAYELLNADRVSVFLVDHDRGELVLAVSEDAAGLRIPLKKGIVGKVASSGQTLNIQDAYSSPLFDRTFDQRTGYRTHSILCCPIFGIDGKVTGVIQAINKLSKHRSRTPRESDSASTAAHTFRSSESVTSGTTRVLEFTPRDITILRLVADTAGVTLHKARLIQEANAARAASAALVDILHLDEDDAMWGNIHALSSRLIPLAQRLVPCSRMYLYIVDSVKKELFRAMGPHDKIEQKNDGSTTNEEGDEALTAQLLRVPITDGLTGKAISTGMVLNLEFPEKETVDSSDTSDGEGVDSPFQIRSSLVVPIFAPKTKRVVAVLKALNRQGGSPFTKHDEAMLDVFTSEVGGILDKRLMQLTLSKVVADELEEEKLNDKDKGRLGRFAMQIGGGKISSLLSYYSNAGQVSAIQNQYTAPPRSLKSVALGLIKRKRAERERERLRDKEDKGAHGEVLASGSAGSAVLALTQRRATRPEGETASQPLSPVSSVSSQSEEKQGASQSSTVPPLSDEPKHTPVPTVETEDLGGNVNASMRDSDVADVPKPSTTDAVSDAVDVKGTASISAALDSSESDPSTIISSIPGATSSTTDKRQQVVTSHTDVNVKPGPPQTSSDAKPGADPLKVAIDADTDTTKETAHSPSTTTQSPSSVNTPLDPADVTHTDTPNAATSEESPPSTDGSSMALSNTMPSKPLPHIRLMARWRQCPPRPGRSVSQHQAPRSWHFEPLDHHPYALVEFMEDMLHTLDLYNTMHIDPVVMHNFLHSVRKAYRPNPYHNFFHGVSVAQIVFTALFKSSAAALAVGGPVNRLALILCALCHDVDHTGYNNAFESNSLSPLALFYNDTSVLEQHHAATMFSLLRGDERQKRTVKTSVIATMLGTNEFDDDKESTYKDAEATIETDVISIFQLPRPVFSAFRKMSVAGILSTDMSHHNSLTEKARKYIPGTAPESSDPDAPVTVPEPVLDMPAQLAIELLVHSADLSNPVLPDFYSSCRWTDMVCAEFRQQVQREKEEGLPFAPHMDGLGSVKAIAKLQTGFIDYVVAPLWNAMGQLFVELQPLSVSLGNNRQNWQKIYDAPESETKDLTNATDAATAVLNMRHVYQAIEPLNPNAASPERDVDSPGRRMYTIPQPAPSSGPYVSYSRSMSSTPSIQSQHQLSNTARLRPIDPSISATSVPTPAQTTSNHMTPLNSSGSTQTAGFKPLSSGGADEDKEKKRRSTSRGWLRRLLRREQVP